MNKHDAYPVDMVYLWCDGNDPEFSRRKALYQKKAQHTDEAEGGNPVRFFDNEELKYSLRSLEMYAPWIRHVFIVTDRQKPKWLDTECSKVTVVDHSEIIPKEIIPCFNSSVIERYIAFIPRLAEHFLYANDDIFFGAPVAKDFFFSEGKPIVRLKYFRKNEQSYSEAQFQELCLDDSDSFGKSVVNAWKLLLKRNQMPGKMMQSAGGGYPFLELHHNIDAFTKTGWIRAFSKYEEDLAQSIHRFRSPMDISRVLFSLDFIVSGRGEMRLVKECSRWEKLFFWLKRPRPESYYADATERAIFILSRLQPTLFCINNSGDSDSGNKMEKRFLDKRFPMKSSFEK